MIISGSDLALMQEARKRFPGRRGKAPIVITHFRRHYEKTFYIKAEGEVDLAYVDANTFWPIEIKWTKQLHTKELKQVMKYKNAQIWAKAWGFLFNF